MCLENKHYRFFNSYCYYIECTLVGGIHCLSKEEFMTQVQEITTVCDYTDYFGLEQTDPMVGVIDLRKATNWPSEFHLTFDVYVVQLMGTHCGEIRYGRNSKYNFDAGTIITYSPGQHIDVSILPGERPSARSVMFHPDYIRGTALEESIKQYTFFSYSHNEALYVSEEEQQIFLDCLQRIKTELAKTHDDFQRDIVCMNLELLLKHCSRFYARQFETSRELNHDILAKFELLLKDYYTTDNAHSLGLPTVKYFADKVFLTPNYFGDLVKSITGRTARDLIHEKIIDEAKDRLTASKDTLANIAYEMGFQTPQHFNRMFKNATGITPNEYRKRG